MRSPLALLAAPQAAAEYVSVTQVGTTLSRLFRDAWLIVSRNPMEATLLGAAIVIAVLAWIRYASR